jgi:hypothetical protein
VFAVKETLRWVLISDGESGPEIHEFGGTRALELTDAVWRSGFRPQVLLICCMLPGKLGDGLVAGRQSL